MSSFSIHVIIPTHNRGVLLRRTLESLADCNFPSNLGKVYVVENGSTIAQDIVAPFLDKMPIQLVQTPTPNKSQALNDVLQLIPEEDFLLFLDDDVRVIPTLIELYNAVAHEWGSNYYYGGPTGVDYEVEPDRLIKKYLPVSAVGFSKPYIEPQIMDSVTLLGFNWGCFKSSISTIGGFDPDKGPGATTGSRGQESDAQRRLFAMGIQPVYIPQAMVYHYIPEYFFYKKWILKRAYQYGVYHGLENKLKKRKLNIYFTMLLLQALNTLQFALPEEICLKLDNKINYYKGVIKGLTLRAEKKKEVQR